LVVHARIFNALLKLGLNIINHLCDFHVLINVIVGLETANSHLEVLESLLKFFLFKFHIFYHLLLLFVKSLHLGLHSLSHGLGCAKELPFGSELLTGELNLKLVQNVVGDHALINLLLHLFDSDSLLLNVFLKVSHLIDGLGDSEDFGGDLTKFSI